VGIIERGTAAQYASAADRRGGRILVVRVGRTGDAVMITPALRMILEGFPGSEVHVLGSADVARVLRGFDPRLTVVHRYHRRFPETFSLAGRMRRTLRDGGYARVLVFESNPHYHGLVRDVAAETWGFQEAASEAHFAARCLAVVEAALRGAGLPVPPRGWLELPVTEAGRAAAAKHFESHGIGPGDVPVGLHCTWHESGRLFTRDRRGVKHRQWPDASWAALATALRDAGRARGMRIRPVVDLLPEEMPRTAGVLSAAGEALTVMTAPPDFERYKATLERLRLFITPNTGPMHVAAAVGAPVLALFSDWRPEECGPFVAPGRSRVLRAEDMPSPDRGLSAIPPAAVLDAALEMLA
jgi:ADP-heptose:LPS heptosyltransferase